MDPRVHALLAVVAKRLDRRGAGQGHAVRSAVAQGDHTRAAIEGGVEHTLRLQGSRGPKIVWRIVDGDLDPGHGLVVVLDETVIPLDYEIAEYTFDLDGELRSRTLVGFTAVFTH